MADTMVFKFMCNRLAIQVKDRVDGVVSCDEPLRIGDGLSDLVDLAMGRLGPALAGSLQPSYHVAGC